MGIWLQKIKGLRNIVLNKPVLLIFNVTRQCNQRCLMCRIPEKSVLMSLDEILLLADKMKKFGICEVYLQGGEPLLRSDILDIVDIFIKKSIVPTIITNGELLNQRIIQEIANRQCNLSVSIDTFIPELYAKLRGKDSLKKVLDNLKFLKLIKHKGVFSITSTITKYTTLEDLGKIQDYCKKMNLFYYVRPYNHNLNKAGAEIEELVCDNTKTIEILKHFNLARQGLSFLASIIYEENISFLQGKRYNFCDALKYSMVLNEDGQISPCIEHTDLRFSFDDYCKEANKISKFIKNCNKHTPCIYGCTRNVGFIVKNAGKIILNIFKLF